MKITSRKQVDTIIEDYTINLKPMVSIAKDYGMTRQAIHKLLRKEGVDTTKHPIKVTCCACGKETERPRCQVRNRKRLFCSDDCYKAYLNSIGDGYRPWRQGQRVARNIVSKVFELQEGHVVHHIDKNNWNNELANLMVLSNQGDHVRLHRGFDVKPLWP
jgi:endogenous inhibitor of DNA gyrase (YacG/DUF329 family)